MHRTTDLQNWFLSFIFRARKEQWHFVKSTGYPADVLMTHFAKSKDLWNSEKQNNKTVVFIKFERGVNVCVCVCVCVCDTAQIINHTCKTVLMETGQHAGWIRVPDGLNLGTMWTQSGYYHTGLIWAHTGIHMFPMYIMGPLCRPQWGPYNLNPHVLGMVVVLVLSIHYSIPILCYAGGEWFRFVTFG